MKKTQFQLDFQIKLNCKIETTDVALKGQTVSSSYKPAVLDNGIKIQVPPFIETGDEIILDTRSIEYIKKYKNMNSYLPNLNIMIKSLRKSIKIY